MAMDKSHLSPEQPFKVEVVEEMNKAGWKALRLTTKGCSRSTVRSIGKQRVTLLEDFASVRT